MLRRAGCASDKAVTSKIGWLLTWSVTDNGPAARKRKKKHGTAQQSRAAGGKSRRMSPGSRCGEDEVIEEVSDEGEGIGLSHEDGENSD